VRIWYPLTPDEKNPAPLVVLSHGTGGNSLGHVDTAMALVRAGFVVAALDHTGDNSRDMSYVGKGTHLAGRPRHISRVIDYVLAHSPYRPGIDRARIGLFGHSAGGFTALVVAGAEPDLTRGGAFCRERPQSWTCRYLRDQGYSTASLARQKRIAWHHDPRVRAIAIAAPAIGYSFDKKALEGVRIPVQLWAAAKDAIVDDSPQTIRAALPVPPDYHRVDGANHFSFLTPCNAALRTVIAVMRLFGTEAICSEEDGFDRATFHDAMNAGVVRFFKDTLR